MLSSRISFFPALSIVLIFAVACGSEEKPKEVEPTMIVPDSGRDVREVQQVEEEIERVIKPSKNPKIDSLRQKFALGSWEYEVLDFIESEEMSASFNLDKVPYEGGELPAEATLQLDNLSEIANSFPYILMEIQARFKLKDGKIISHLDEFNVHQWATQAMGFSGWLIGWTAYFKKKLRVQTNGLLDRFEKSQKST